MWTSALVSAIAGAALVSATPCPNLGPILPVPKAPSRHHAVQEAVKNVTAELNKFTASFNTSALSIGVKSIHEDNQLLSYHFTPPQLSGIGTKKIDENTIYRVGSVSKLLTALAVVQNDDIDLDASILEYIPELKNATNSDPLLAVAWEDVTIRALATHLSGLATDTAFDLALVPSAPWTQMGLPEVPKGKGPSCSGLAGSEPCGKADLIRDLAKRSPIYLPYTTPAYSNVGYALLGLVVEKVTGLTLQESLQKTVYSVAGMNSTSYNGPVKSFSEIGFVPKDEQTWNITIGVFEAAGGLFSSTKDLLSLAEAILTSKLMPPNKTRSWIRPESHTSALGSSVGAPWEILRGDNLTPDGRVIDVYTKSGDLGLYHAYAVLIPDYDIVMSLITAGAEVSIDQQARNKVLSAVVQGLLPSIDGAGRDQAKSAYVASYAEKSTNSTLKLSIEADSPGLTIDAFTVRGFDVLQNINSYSLSSAESGAADSGDAPAPTIAGWLTPTNRRHTLKDGSVETAWRANFAVESKEADEEEKKVEKQLFWEGATCETWFGMDRAAYNFLSLGEFVIVEDSNGHVKEIKNKAFNVTLTAASYH